MENYIKIGDKQITCDPKNEKEYNECINACVSILATMVAIGTAGQEDSKKRTEHVLKFSGEIGGAIAKNVILIMANEQAAKTVPAKKEEGNTDA